MAAKASPPCGGESSNDDSQFPVRYINSFLRFESLPQLIASGLYRDVREITAALALYRAYCDYIIDVAGGNPMIIVVESNGIPRVGALFTTLLNREVLAIAPGLTQDKRKEYEAAFKKLRIYTDKPDTMLLNTGTRDCVIINYGTTKLSDIAAGVISDAGIAVISMAPDSSNDLLTTNNTAVQTDVEYTDFACLSEVSNNISIYYDVETTAVEFGGNLSPTDDDEEAWDLEALHDEDIGTPSKPNIIEDSNLANVVEVIPSQIKVTEINPAEHLGKATDQGKSDSSFVDVTKDTAPPPWKEDSSTKTNPYDDHDEDMVDLMMGYRGI